MGDSHTVPYLTRLRLLAWRAGYLYYRLNKLDPVYDTCPVSCRAPHADPANGCPDCEYTNYFAQFRKEYEAELRREYERRIGQSDTGNTLPGPVVKELAEEMFRQPPGFDELLDAYGRLLALEEFAGTETADRAGGHNPLWTIRTAEAIRAIREGRRLARRELDRERQADWLARMRELGLLK